MTTEVDPLDSLPSGVKLLLRHLHALIPKKLSDINYPTWKITVLTALEANYLLKYVDGSTEPPPAVITATDKSEKTNPGHAAWKAVDCQIRSCLIAVISPTVQKHVRSYTTASTLWRPSQHAMHQFPTLIFFNCVIVSTQLPKARKLWRSI